MAGPGEKLNVIIAGGGVAALETALALADLAGDRTEVTLIAPNSEFFERRMVTREPFAYGPADRYKRAWIARDAGAELLRGGAPAVDRGKQIVQTEAGQTREFGALVLAPGARTEP